MSKKTVSTNRHFRQLVKKLKRQGYTEQDAADLAANRLRLAPSIPVQPQPPAGATVLSDEERKALFGEPEPAQEPA